MKQLTWQEKIEKYCENFNLPLYYLAETLNDPKVIPMIRGKAFEYTVLEKLQSLLNPKVWKVSKPFINPQLGFHDSDICIEHIESKTKINIECKLAAKGRIKSDSKTTTIAVKCMRSRTLGESMVKKLAPMMGIPEEQLQVHNDQYTPDSFDFIITSIGNAFYETDNEGKFVFSTALTKISFIKNFKGRDLKKEIFNTLFIAPSKNIAVKKENKVSCTRKACKNPKDCGFIPNYPEIKFENNSLTPTNEWKPIDQVEVLVHDYVSTLFSRKAQKIN